MVIHHSLKHSLLPHGLHITGLMTLFPRIRLCRPAPPQSSFDSRTPLSCLATGSRMLEMGILPALLLNVPFISMTGSMDLEDTRHATVPSMTPPSMLSTTGLLSESSEVRRRWGSVNTLFRGLKVRITLKPQTLTARPLDALLQPSQQSQRICIVQVGGKGSVSRQALAAAAAEHVAGQAGARGLDLLGHQRAAHRELACFEHSHAVCGGSAVCCSSTRSPVLAQSTWKEETQKRLEQNNNLPRLSAQVWHVVAGRVGARCRVGSLHGLGSLRD